MLLSVKGLVLHTTVYSETSVITQVFTRELGVRSYILKGVRQAKGRTKQNLLQPMSYLAMVVYDSPKTQINYVKEMHPLQHFNSIAVDPVKGSLLFFMNELLYKVLREAEPMPEVFDYVVASIEEIDGCEGQVSHLPLQFMLRLSQLLGIVPMDNYCHREPIFNPQEGRYQSAGGGVCFSYNDSLLLHTYLEALHGKMPLPLTNIDSRLSLLDALLEYYRYHVSGFKNFRSHEILHEVLR